MRALPVLILALFAAGKQAEPVPKLTLEKGDRICLVGNTLADRLQHHGWLETVLQSRFPGHELTVRNLGFSGDEITTRLRSAGFGSPDHWLSFTKADVVFAFFGYNESFAGEAGLEKFKKDLGDWVRHVRAQNYNGRSAPRVVLFSPAAHEDLRDPNLPDGKATNARLALYARAMAEVARAAGVPFVDLFAPTARAYARAASPLTINGIHFHERGNEVLARLIDEALFGAPGPVRESGGLERLRQAVLDKDFHWYQRYRTTDGYSIYGGRADLKFVGGQTNRVVMQRELEILDAMTANRDRRVWAAANGRDLKVDDSNTPGFVPVVTNKPGAGPGGAHVFMDAELAITRMQVAKGMKVNLFASEERFPELANPVQVAFDPKGRLWVAAWPTYVHWRPKDPMNDRLLIFEDDDGDGKADRCKTFAGDLHNPTGFEFWNGGVLVAQGPGVLFLKDTDGDDKADVRERVLEGIDTADTHHTINSFVFDPGGGLYMQEGTFHHTQVESPYGPPVRLANGGVFRYEPRTHKFETFVTFGFANPHGHVFERWGQNFVTDGTTEETYYAVTYSGRSDFPRKHPKPPRIFQQRTRPCPATEILSSRHFPPENQGNLLVANVIGFLGILQYKLLEKGSGFQGVEVEPILQSSDPNFRPTDLEIGPDGAIYFVDWQNPIIGHMQHNLRDPSRDHAHGRVYRVTCLDRPLLKPAPVAGQPIPKLLDRLKEPEDRVRYRARIELGSRKTAEVLAALAPWVAALDKTHADYEHHLLEALWLHQNHNVVNLDLLKRMLRSPEPRARAAATRVLRFWRDRVPEALALLKVQANDEFPRVRLEAVVTASFFEGPEAVLAALECLKHDRDEFLTYSLKETLVALEPHWKAALREGTLALPADNPGAADYLLSLGADPKKLPRTAGVHQAILTHPGSSAAARRDALRDLAKARKLDELSALLEVISKGSVPADHFAHVMGDLAQLLAARPAAELKAAREKLRALARDGGTAEARRAGYAAWMAADGSGDAAFAEAPPAPGALRDLLGAVPLVPQEEVRGSLYPKIRRVLADLGSAEPTGRGILAELFGLPDNAARETFAALKPRASATVGDISLDIPLVQHRDRFGLRFTGSIHIPKDGAYTFYTASDDGSRLYIDGTLVVNNDGAHGMVEKSGTIELKAGPHALLVTYFDGGGDDGLVVSWKGPGMAKERIPGRVLSVAGGQSLEDVALAALDAVPGHEREKFADLAALVRARKHPGPAARSLLRIDRKHWEADQAGPLFEAAVAFLGGLKPEDRTTPGALDVLQLGRDLAERLPADRVAAARAALKAVDVQILVIRPVPHQMLFDRKKFAVEAGRTVEILFDNVDVMPHNLVITAPGAMAEVGQLAEAMGLEGQNRNFIPDSRKVLWATKLVQPGQSQKLQFRAPEKPGNYPYVCTFPGHWLVMNGVMVVVEPGASTALSETETAASPARPFVKLWALEDLEPHLGGLAKGRTFARGKEMFTAAGCVKCHALGGEGAKIGPDLAKVTEKYKTGKDVLRQILDPSSEINEQYRAVVLQTADDETVAGLIVKEDARGLHVLTNPLEPDKVTVLPKEKVKARKASTLSSMPTGLLSTLQKDEILDLVAYVLSGADPNHDAFK
jgi:putative heme-binding domain-containing protein